MNQISHQNASEATNRVTVRALMAILNFIYWELLINAYTIENKYVTYRVQQRQLTIRLCLSESMLFLF